MSIQSDFLPYRDGNGLMAPNVVPSGTLRGSDNGTMYTSEYMIMLSYNDKICLLDRCAYLEVIYRCTKGGKLYKSPQDTIVDTSPDNYYGVYAAYAVLGHCPVISLPLVLWRQPQLLLMKWSAEGQIPILGRLLTPLAAIIIALSCRSAPTSDTDSRRLSWLLIQSLAPKSWICRQAAKIWYKRLAKDYPGEMQDVAGIYYQPHPINPYSKYWVTNTPLESGVN